MKPCLYVLAFLQLIGVTPASFAQQAKLFTLVGVVKDAKKGTQLVGAAVTIEGTSKGVITDQEGFMFKLPSGTYVLTTQYVGYLPRKDTLTISSLTIYDIELTEANKQLEEIIITEQAQDRNIAETKTGVTKFSIKTLKKIAAIGGETDILKGLLLLPGVASVGEGAIGFNVRGGNIDQNLILMDDAPIYTSSHLMGLLSVFNPDAIRDITFYRGGIPAQFGGRVSSVADVRVREPANDSLMFQGGVGMAASRFMAEGPLWGKKLSFLTAARFSFADYLFKQIPNVTLQQTKANFYELTAKLFLKSNSKNQLYLTAFLSQDAFKVAGDSLTNLEVNATSTLFRWKTENASFHWKHIFTEQWVGDGAAVWSNYTSVLSNQQPDYAFDLTSKIQYQSLRYTLNYSGNQHDIEMGINGVRYEVQPGNLQPGLVSNVNPKTLPAEKSVELAAFYNDEWKLSPQLSLTYGMRLVWFAALGPTEVLTYQPGLPRDPVTQTGSQVYSSGQIMKTFNSLEPRVTLRWRMDSTHSIKWSYHRIKQFLQLISNTTAALPTARWKTVDLYTDPQQVDQVAVGYYRNLQSNAFELSIEFYYKALQGVSDYRSGINLLLTEHPETAILQGTGRAYGVELMVTKRMGALTGWCSYTYAQSKMLIHSQYPEDATFSGQWYPTNYNKPHQVNLVAIWQKKHRVSYSLNFTYSTGRPATFPQDKYFIDGLYIPNYTNRNQDRVPDYHRLDLSVTINSRILKGRRWQGSWVFSIYNVYGRQNAYSIFFRTKNESAQEYYNRTNGYKLSVFGTIFPAITYNFKF
ncbi:MAG: TonB-dependent receptor [Spirosomataceae bacterium]